MRNYRGVEVPRWLGALIAVSGAAGSVAIAVFGHVDVGGWRVLGGSVLVFAAGLVDDLAPEGPRGLRGHLRALAQLQVTTGALKLFVVTAVSLVVVVSLPPRGPALELAGIATLAGCANLWNGLDVRPGRALKAFFPVAIAPLILAPSLALPLAPTLPGVLVAAAIVLPLDLRELAMLGDGGSNLLGFTAGVGLYVALPGWGLIISAALALALNVAAETVTLSRLIERTPALAWVDRIGRPREI